MAKLFASEVALRATLEAMRVHGAYGYSTELEIGACTGPPLMAIGEGTNDILRTIIRGTCSNSCDSGSSRPFPAGALVKDTSNE